MRKTFNTKTFVSIILSFFFSIVFSNVNSEPFVVLQYNQNDFNNETNDFSSHPFRMDQNYSTKHKVQKNETLSHIIENYYYGSGLDVNFLRMSIVKFNKHAFVRSNPNFLYADKTIHLPSINEINSMFLGKKSNEVKSYERGETRNEIFFFSN